jgi:hypothetical protein
MIRRGDLVFNIKDPRHVGFVRSTIIGKSANVKWRDTGWLEYLIPIGELRHAPVELAPGIENPRLLMRSKQP